MSQCHSSLKGAIATGCCRGFQCDIENDVKLTTIIGGVGKGQGSTAAGLQSTTSGISTAFSSIVFTLCQTEDQHDIR